METIIHATEDEAHKLSLEGNAIILGGVEVHVKFVRYQGSKRRSSWTLPAVRARR